LLQPIEKIRFLPAVEMTHSTNLTFYEFVKIIMTIEEEGFLLITDSFLNGKRF